MSSAVSSYLAALHARHRGVTEGEIATYIPELADADPAHFGICVTTVDGRTYEAGDTRIPFTIQSISKPFVYGLALQEKGPDAVRAVVGVEPTGEAFNSITLDPATGRPLNPMVNAGAIAIASLVAGATSAKAVQHMSEFAGRRLTIDQTVAASESATGHRNRAIAHLLHGSGSLAHGVDESLDFYFDQCSVLVDCRDLSAMAATLANGGVQPVTGVVAAAPTVVRAVLTLMASCGMYDGAGQWLLDVGLPAKSGVTGAIIAVLPGQLGIAVYSPPLDNKGNSVRGVRVCRDLSTELDLHLVPAGHHGPSPIRAKYTLANVRSRRQRTPAENEYLAVVGGHVQVIELQGDLDFHAAELVSRTMAESGAEINVLDLHHVDQVNNAFLELITQWPPAGTLVVSRSTDDSPWPATMFEDLDVALEWCEDRIGLPDRPQRVELAQHDLVRNVSAEDLALFESLVEPREFRAGETVLREGDPPDHVLLILSGRLSVYSAERRIATLDAGMLVGEMALVARHPRSATVIADSDVSALALSQDAISRLREANAALRATLLENVVQIMGRRVDRIRADLTGRLN